MKFKKEKESNRESNIKAAELWVSAYSTIEDPIWGQQSPVRSSWKS